MYTAVLINNQLYLTDIAKNGLITTLSKTGSTQALHQQIVQLQQ